MIVALVEGGLRGGALARVEAHLDVCSSCSGVVAILGRGRGSSASNGGGWLLLSVGERVGRYEIRSFIGAGGMGAVYRARDCELDRDVALKMLRAAPDELGPLRREARAMARVNHPAVVEVFDIGLHDAGMYIAMAHVAGTDLARRISHAPLPPSEVIRVFVDAARGLHAAHAAGMVHRDFKPSNVLLREDGRVFVSDFGLARWGSDGTTPGPTNSAGDTSIRARVVGTPGYMAPEQLRGEAIDARADQFALCVALYEALCGRRPALPLPRALPRAVPASLAPILRRGLASDPSRRWPSMAAVIDGLRRAGRPRSRTRWVGLAAATTAITVGVAVGPRLAPPAASGHCRTEARSGWTPAAAAEISRAFAASASPLAAEADVRTRHLLDAYASRWSSAYAAVCTAPDERRELATECLGGARARLSALTLRLQVAEASTVERAVAAVQGLPDPSACLEDRPLLQGAPASLADATAVYDAGNVADANRLAAAAVERGRAQADPRLEAHAHYLLGRIQRVDGAFDAAEREFTDAYHLATDAEDPMLAASAATQLVRVSWDMRRDPARAEQWAGHARTALSRDKNASLGEARLASVLAQVAAERGDPGAALRWSEQAIVAYRRLVHVAVAERCGALRFHATRLAEAGRSGDAAEAIAEAIASARAFGPGHPQMAFTYKARAMVAAADGRQASAASDFARALEIFERLRGPDAAVLYPILSGLCLARAASRPREAEAACRRGLAIASATFGESPHTGRAMVHLADALPKARAEESLGLYRRASEIFRQELGPSNELLLASVYNVGVVLEDEGRVAEALPRFAEALRIATEVLGPAHDFTTEVRERLARLRPSQQAPDTHVHLRVEEADDAVELAG